MTKHKSESGKVILGVARPMPLRPIDDDPVLTDTIGGMAPISLLQNGVIRVAGSYLFRNRVDAVIGELQASDVQAWDLRVDGIDPVADATFPEFQIAPPVAAVNYLFNGTTFDRQTSAGAGSLAADPTVGAMLVTGPGEWTEFAEPAVAVVATTTKAAGGATERHICKSISGHCAAAAGAPSGLVFLRLRDGAAGAGTILWSGVMDAVAGTTVMVNLSGLNILGSLATAMTLEFSAAPGAAAAQTVTLVGITVG